MKKYFLKIISVIGIIAICISCIGATASASPTRSEDEIISSVEQLIKTVYECKDLGNSKASSLDSLNLLSKDISDYICAKINTNQYATQLNGTYKNNYKVETRLLDKEITANNKIKLQYQVIASFNYENCDFDSEYSEVAEILYDLSKGKVEDFYVQHNYYDISMRGESRSKDVLEGNVYNLSDDFLTKQEKLIEDIYEDAVSLKTEETVSSTSVQPSSSTINGSASATYALNNCKLNQPASGKSSVPYYDFSEISGNYDCTNFVSHALIAGGAGIYDPGGSGLSSVGWYYRSLGNRSYSWSGVKYLYNFLTKNTKANTAAGTGRNYTHNGSYWGIGDVMQLSVSPTTDYGHSTIITKKSKVDNHSYAYVTGRTADNWYNYNQSAEDVYPGGGKRTISVYNN